MGHAQEYGDLFNLSRAHQNDCAEGEGAPQAGGQHGYTSQERDPTPPKAGAISDQGERSGGQALRAAGSTIQGSARRLHARDEAAKTAQRRPGGHGCHRVCRQRRRAAASEAGWGNARSAGLDRRRLPARGPEENIQLGVTLPFKSFSACRSTDYSMLQLVGALP